MRIKEQETYKAEVIQLYVNEEYSLTTIMRIFRTQGHITDIQQLKRIVLEAGYDLRPKTYKYKTYATQGKFSKL